MTTNERPYNIAIIRKLLLASFKPESLRRFCLDQPLFLPVVASFGPGHGLDDMVDRVIDYCRTKQLWDEFLTAVREEYPRQYIRFEHELQNIALSGSEVESTALRESIASPTFSAEKPQPQVFLCYARQDKGKVEALYQRLSDAGFRPWMDTKDILPGEKWRSRIEQAVKESDFFLSCLSKNSVNKRGFLQREIKQALDLWQEKLETDIYLIPVRLEQCEVPESLTGFQWLNLFDEGGWTQLIEALRVGIVRAKEMSESRKVVEDSLLMSARPTKDVEILSQKYEGRRIVLSEPGQPQYFVHAEQRHYVDPGAAEVCRAFKVPAEWLEKHAEVSFKELPEGARYGKTLILHILEEMYPDRVEDANKLLMGAAKVREQRNLSIDRIDDKPKRVSTKKTQKFFLIGAIGIALVIAAIVNFGYLAGQACRLLDPPNKDLVQVAESTSFSANFSPDGSLLATSVIHSTGERSLQVWNVKNKKIIYRAYETENAISSVTFSNHGEYLAYGTENGLLVILNTDDFQTLHRIEAHSFGSQSQYEDRQTVQSIAFSPDGKFIVSGGADWTIKMWDVVDASLVHTFQEQNNMVEDVAISPDGKLLAASVGYVNDRENSDRAVYIWDIESRDLLRKIAEKPTDWQDVADSIEFSNNGQLLVVGNFTGSSIWDVNSGEFVGDLAGSWGAFDIAFTQDENLLAIGTYDEAQIWNIIYGELVTTLYMPRYAHVDNYYSRMRDNKCERGIVYGVDFSPDGKYLATASGSGLYLWEVEP